MARKIKLHRNRWGLLFATGDRVEYQSSDGRRDRRVGVVTAVSYKGRFETAYGPQATINSGVGRGIDDITRVVDRWHAYRIRVAKMTAAALQREDDRLGAECRATIAAMIAAGSGRFARRLNTASRRTAQ